MEEITEHTRMQSFTSVKQPASDNNNNGGFIRFIPSCNYRLSDFINFMWQFAGLTFNHFYLSVLAPEGTTKEITENSQVSSSTSAGLLASTNDMGGYIHWFVTFVRWTLKN